MGLLSMSTQGQVPKPEKERWWTPDRRDRLVLGLEGMTLNPNRGLMLAASQGIQGRREDRKEQETQRQAEERRTRIAEWLASRPGGEMYAQAIMAGGDPKGMLNNYMKASSAADDPSVQSSAMLPDQSGTVMTMRDGSLRVMTVGGETLTGDAAMQHVRNAQERAAELQRGIEQQAQREIEERRTRTAEWLASRPGGEMYAQAIMAGGDPKGMLNNYMKASSAADDPSVQSSAMLPDQSGTVMTMRDGSLRVMTVGGETLTGDAAMQHVRNAQERAAELQRGIYSARREGTLGADIWMGGEAERAKAEGKMAPEMARSYLQQAELVGSTIRNMSSAIQAIDEGAQSGIVYNMLPNVTRASAELANAKQRLGLDVIGSVTFGALSEGEMKLAMDTAVPQNLGPKELREWLTQKREAQTKMHAALMEASAHFASGGSMAEYVRKVQGEQSGGDQSLSDDDLLRKYGGQ